MSSIDNIFFALSDEKRRLILTMLSKEKLHVNAIAEKFSVSRPAISKHLRILERAELVTPLKVGKQNFYSIKPKNMKTAFNWLKYYERFWDEKLDALKLFVEREHNGK